MANKKITELNAASSLAATDVVPVVDVSADETKKITATDLFRTLPDGTAAAPALAFSSDQANGVYLAGTDTVGISTGGTQRVTVDGSGNVTISGDLTVSGATTTVESTTVTIDDKNIELGSVASPSNTTADGGGITLKGATDKTLKWINSTGCWTFNQPMNFNDHVRIDSSGNVGIGTTAASVPLTVNSTSDHSDIAIFHAGGGTPNRGLKISTFSNINSNAGVEFDAQTSTGAFKFSTGGTEHARLTSDGKLGVGTSAPGTKLEVKDTTVDGTPFKITGANNYGYSFRSQAAGGINGARLDLYIGSSAGTYSFTNSSSELLRIDSSGRLLLGTTTEGNGDADDLTVATSGNTGITVRSGTANTGNLYFSDATSGTAEFAGAVTYNHSSNELRFRTNTTENVVIDSSGNCGINETSPGQRLVVGGDMRIGFTTPTDAARSLVFDSNRSSAGATLTNITFNWNSTAVSQIRAIAGADTTNKDDGELALFTSAAGSIVERLRIDSSGNVGIGTSSPGSYSTSANNLVVQDTAGPGGITIASTTTGASNIFFADTDSTTQGRIAYQHAGDYMRFYTANTERLRIDSSGRLMLGTTTEGSVNADDFTVATGATTGITIRSGTSSSGNLYFSDGTSGDAEYRGYINYNHSDDRLTIGTASSGRLSINSNGAWGIEGASNYGTSGQVLTSNGNDSPTWQDASGGGATDSISEGNTNVECVDTGSDGHILFDTEGSERMRIDSSGRLLIGHSSSIPVSGSVAGTLQVIGTRNSFTKYSNDAFGPTLSLGKSRGSVGNFTSVSANDSLGMLQWAGSDGTDLQTEAARIEAQVDGTPGSNDMPGRLVFSTTADGGSSTTERMRIESSGRLLVGTTSSTDASVVFENTQQVSFRLNNTNISPVGMQIRYTTDVNNTANKFIDCIGNATSRFIVNSNGDCKNINNSFGAISDAKLKENIVDASSQWDDIKELRVRNYNLIENPARRQIGVVAQEVETVSPGLVSESPDIDDDGNDLGTVTKSVNYSVLYMKAVKALQEAMDRIETLETKVAALEAQ